ncbi:MAG: hypothetical protein WCK02_00135 [Bacteroidota bacterium]
MKHILLIVLSSFTLFSFGQDPLHFKRDSTFKSNAENYKNTILNTDFAKNNVKFRCMQHAGISVAVYETTTTKNQEGRNTLFVYFKYGKYDVDTIRSIFDTVQIRNSINGDKNCNLYIGIEKSIEIARAAGLKDGIKQWEIGLTNVGLTQIPKWIFTSTYGETKSGSYHANGESISVSLINGETEKTFWNAIE